ncbi:RES family NAD+ phosphorylase [Rhodocytophaga rosea]|uniref:RES family NAD+ phosphorylase n=1 Tax=Rhodocytophaga rosea TaxID=2704465 RepID=A0A6C0GD57_9BACT|nr:RES family NAD+ phosphorylase [Rhodocytophaga rosea]QHT65837.1 RES family NAD+ phosphorylase [Rhodocytophaga rosea]
MIVYRIGKAAYIQDLSGTGGLFGSGRWHKQGTRIIYTSESVSLAKLEILANYRIIPPNMHLLTLKIPDKIPVQTIDVTLLPQNWQDINYPEALAEIALTWIKGLEYACLRVPSAQSVNEYNVLLNPLHQDHSKIKILKTEPVFFDPRLKMS